MGVPIVFYQYDEKITMVVSGDYNGTQPKARWPPNSSGVAHSGTDHLVLRRHDLPGFVILVG